MFAFFFFLYSYRLRICTCVIQCLHFPYIFTLSSFSPHVYYKVPAFPFHVYIVYVSLTYIQYIAVKPVVVIYNILYIYSQYSLSIFSIVSAFSCLLCFFLHANYIAICTYRTQIFIVTAFSVSPAYSIYFPSTYPFIF